jgi:hypothetical protein
VLASALERKPRQNDFATFHDLVTIARRAMVSAA